MSKIGIVILNNNDYQSIREYITKIKKIRSLNEIVIVDNNSDSTYESLKKMEKGNVSVLKSVTDKGYAYGINIGIKYLKDKVDYIIVTNPNIDLVDSVIRELKKDMDKDSDISLISPIIKNGEELIKGYKMPKVFDEIKLSLSKKNILLYEDKKYNGELTRVDLVSRDFFMIRRDILNMVGNLDDSTYLYYEEKTLGMKLKNINKKSYVSEKVKLTYNTPVITDRINDYKLLKNSQVYFVKYYLHANIFQMVILRIVNCFKLLCFYIKKIFKEEYGHKYDEAIPLEGNFSVLDAIKKNILDSAIIYIH